MLESFAGKGIAPGGAAGLQTRSGPDTSLCGFDSHSFPPPDGEHQTNESTRRDESPARGFRRQTPRFAIGGRAAVPIEIAVAVAFIVIVATAGHIDHGKTTLVKALTGVDTSRLPEEKARGITIDIGFAYWRTPEDNLTVGFVDVPGHERFVHNMLAGVCGVDYVMLLVAADDGVMPQTIEHLNIVNLLGISRGIAVITKIDRVPAERVRTVAESVRALLESTALSGIDMQQVSAVSGAGIGALRARLQAAAAEHQPTRIRRRFRFAIDRVFTVAGSGTVVTGTAFAGVVHAGDRLMLSPGGVEVRVRGIQKNGRAATEAAAGERCALNLAGVDVSRVGRGDWVVDPALHAPTQLIGVRVQVLAAEAQALRHWTPVHLHLATGDVTARIGFRRGQALQPGQSGFGQLVLDRPVAALHGERFIIRDQSAQRTLGGGTVIDPFPPGRASRSVQTVPRERTGRDLREQQLLALDTGNAADALSGLISCSPAGIDVRRFQLSFNIVDDDLAALLETHGLLVTGKDAPVALPRDVVERMRNEVIETLTRFHEDSPHAVGMDLADLNRTCAPSLTLAVFQQLLRDLIDSCRIAVSGSTASIARHIASENPEDDRIWQSIEPKLRDAGLNGFSVVELAGSSGIAEKALSSFLHRKARTGDVIRVTPNRFYLRRTIEQFAAIALEIAALSPSRRFTVAGFRDHSGVGRGRVVEVLECMDRLRITQRLGDARIVNEESLRKLVSAGRTDE